MATVTHLNKRRPSKQQEEARRLEEDRTHLLAAARHLRAVLEEIRRVRVEVVDQLSLELVVELVMAMATDRPITAKREEKVRLATAMRAEMEKEKDHD
jgi:hypothetical protein